MDLLFAPATVASIVGLAVIVVVALLRDNFGETEADRLIKVGQSSMRLAQLVLEAAQIAVVEVEESLKDGEMAPEELKQAAVTIAAELLESWGIVINQAVISSLFSVVEAAYQRLKAAAKGAAELDALGLS
jgi:hypothetical protein